MKEPTADECSKNAEVSPGAFAVWYPQIGGYVAKAVIVAEGGCFRAYVWHDGDFPFGDGENPRVLHHCSAAQFVDFGQLVTELLGDEDERR